MVSFNRVALAGNLTRDPELRFTQEGMPVASFSIAVNRVQVKKRGRRLFQRFRPFGEPRKAPKWPILGPLTVLQPTLRSPITLSVTVGLSIYVRVTSFLCSLASSDCRALHVIEGR